MKIIVNDPLITGKFIEKYPNYHQSSLLNSLTNRKKIVTRNFPRRKGITTLLNNYIVEELYTRSDYSILYENPNQSCLYQTKNDIYDIIRYRSIYQSYPKILCNTKSQISTVDYFTVRFCSNIIPYSVGQRYDLVISDNSRYMNDISLINSIVKNNGKILLIYNK